MFIMLCLMRQKHRKLWKIALGSQGKSKPKSLGKWVNGELRKIMFKKRNFQPEIADFVLFLGVQCEPRAREIVSDHLKMAFNYKKKTHKRKKNTKCLEKTKLNDSRKHQLFQKDIILFSSLILLR